MSLFKAKRVDEGGTDRFGWRRRRYSRPVRDKIGPRIDKMLKEHGDGAHKYGLSGGQAHRQLLKEGYQVSIIAVYDCLRERHRSAEMISSQGLRECA